MHIAGKKGGKEGVVSSDPAVSPDCGPSGGCAKKPEEVRCVGSRSTRIFECPNIKVRSKYVCEFSSVQHRLPPEQVREREREAQICFAVLSNIQTNLDVDKEKGSHESILLPLYTSLVH